MNALGFSAKEEATLTSLRDIKDLIEKDILQETKEGGRNTNYELTDIKRG